MLYVGFRIAFNKSINKFQLFVSLTEKKNTEDPSIIWLDTEYTQSWNKETGSEWSKKPVLSWQWNPSGHSWTITVTTLRRVVTSSCSANLHCFNVQFPPVSKFILVLCGSAMWLHQQPKSKGGWRCPLFQNASVNLYDGWNGQGY
jgi:hypothetical protein